MEFALFVPNIVCTMHSLCIVISCLCHVIAIKAFGRVNNASEKNARHIGEKEERGYKHNSLNQRSVWLLLT